MVWEGFLAGIADGILSPRERRNEMVWDFGPMVYFWRRPRFHINRRLYIQLSEAGRPWAASETVQTGCQGTSNMPSCHSFFFFLIDRKGW